MKSEGFAPNASLFTHFSHFIKSTLLVITYQKSQRVIILSNSHLYNMVAVLIETLGQK